jgi:hypothetical protein
MADPEDRAYPTRRAGLVWVGIEQHSGSVTDGTAGRSLGRHASSRWVTKQRPACQGGTDMVTKEKQSLDDRGLIRWQMLLGSGLIAFGALSIPLFQMSGVLDGQTATAAFAVATGVIGAGAAMLPTGAAAGASARILRSLPDQEDVADSPRGARNGQPDKTLVLTAPEAINGQADKPARDGQ